MRYQKDILEKLVPINQLEYRQLKEKCDKIEYIFEDRLDKVKETLWKITPRWNDYKPIGTSQSEWVWAIDEYRIDREHYNEKKQHMLRDIYSEIYASNEWYNGSYYVLAMRIYILSFDKNNKIQIKLNHNYPYFEYGDIICEHCKKLIEKESKYYICELHHITYDQGLLNPNAVKILHPHCHNIVHHGIDRHVIT